MTVRLRGAYGVELAGLRGAESWLAGVTDPLERVEVVRGHRTGSCPLVVDHERASFRTAEHVWVSTHRDRSTVVVHSPLDVSDEDLLHPLISPALAVRHLWAGRQVLHGGVVGVPGGAVVVLGGREFGKSSTLADLAARTELDVYADDLCVTDGRRAWTGPRCIDLRAPEAGGPEAHVGPRVVRSATRWRMTLGNAPPQVPLRGTVLLGWAAEERVNRVAPADALAMVVACKMHAEVPSDPAVLLAVGALPMLSIRRPRRLSSLGRTSDRIAAWVRELSPDDDISGEGRAL